ncbi:MAG: GNAT family N-acetyltransferase [Frankiales bacterium]|nr:GNAT family N-acetyltransferase [Frankiales bacterium]
MLLTCGSTGRPILARRRRPGTGARATRASRRRRDGTVAAVGAAVVRRADASDAEAVALVSARSRAAAMPWLPVLHTPEEDVAFFRRELAAGTGWVVVDGDRVLGFAVVDDAAGELGHLYLEPDARRRGLGTALVAVARAHHPGPLRLWCFRDNTGARAFYAALGAVQVGQTDGSGNEEGLPDVLLELPATTTA